MIPTPVTPIRNAPLRLVLVTPEGVAVYEGRKPLATVRSDYRWQAFEIEEIRVQKYEKEKTS